MNPAPDSPFDDQGNPLYGTYLHQCSHVDLRPAAMHLGMSSFKQMKSEKLWQWFGVFDRDFAVGGAIVDVGFAGNAFLWLFDRTSKEFVRDESIVLPPMFTHVVDTPHEGLIARLRKVSRQLEMSHHGDHWRIEGGLRKIRLGIDLDNGSPSITAICPVAPLGEGAVNVTRKQVGLRGRGWVDHRDRHFTLTDEARGMLDHSHGLHGRQTKWLWAMGSGTLEDGREAGFNVVDRFNEGLENVVWIDGEPTPVGEVEFHFDPDQPDTPWRVTTDDGYLDLELDVEGVRQQNINLGLVTSAYAQPLGIWRGTIDGDPAEMVGVAEDHLSRW